jgi:AcrR family transcriptional regulator
MAAQESSEPLQPPWWRPPRSGGRRRQALSRDAIIDAAVAILDAEGVDALTIRRLAQALDTGSATLYWHIGSKDELAEQVYDRLMGEMVLPEPDPTHWQDQIKDLARQGYRVMLRHNDAVRLSLGRVPVGPNMLRVIDWQLGLLLAAGIPTRAAAYFGDMIGRYIDASVLEVAMAPGATGADDRPDVGKYFRSLPTDQFPHLTSLSGALFAGDDDDRFEFGLDLLVTGLAARAYKLDQQ